MAYFNHSFVKTFIADSTELEANVATSALAAGKLALVDGSDWKSVALAGGAAVPAIGAGDLGYIVQGSFYSKDTIGNNPGHGGYKESVKSKGINPRYISRIWKSNCLTASQATAKLCLASDCAPCGKTQFMRIDVKGSPALRFLNHNAYAIGDSANVCCIDGQEYIDPTLVAAAMAEMVLADPIIKPFVAEGGVGAVSTNSLSAAGSGYSAGDGVATSGSATGSGFKVNILTVTGSGGLATYSVADVGAGYAVGDVLDVDGGSGGKILVDAVSEGGVVVSVVTSGQTVQAAYSIEQALGKASSGNYTPSTDPHGASKVSVCINFKGAYVDTVFGNCSFDTRDHFNAEPVEIELSLLDETGNPCNDCGVASHTPGSMQQTQGEEVIRELIMSERYRQSPYNQGNRDSARIREIELSDELLAAIDRSATYRGYYVLHSVPRFNNPTGVFDNDQYLYKIYVKCSDAAAQTAVEKLLVGLANWASDNGNKLSVETNAVW